jgi:hypothetical protein
MSKLKELYQKLVLYTVSYGELLFWSMMIVIAVALLIGGSK